MFDSSTQAIIIFIIVCTVIILILITFITLIIYRYQKKQHVYFKDLEELKINHENALLQSQLEIQEQTFQNISREIHDSIGQKLTLAKLHLNTLDVTAIDGSSNKVTNAIDMIGEAINDLSDISRSMSSELILQNGLIKALEFEAGQLSKLGLYKINISVSCETVFLDAHTELVLFRIVQEALNNIVKHSCATQIDISLDYTGNILLLQIQDNGTGFSRSGNLDHGIGLSNMYKRASMLGGECFIATASGKGTIINIQIPTNEYKQTV
jgi:signal transduction histidine kinase